jgi:hypothetical protein
LFAKSFVVIVVSWVLVVAAATVLEIDINNGENVDDFSFCEKAILFNGKFKVSIINMIIEMNAWIDKYTLLSFLLL